MKIVAEEKNKDAKHKFGLYVRDSAIEEVKAWYKKDNCACMSEYIEKAILFYSGYLASNKNKDYLPNVVVTTLKGIVNDSDNRQGKLLYKIAVELSMMMNILATYQGITEFDLQKLRGNCVAEVNRINGTLSMDEAIRWQN